MGLRPEQLSIEEIGSALGLDRDEGLRREVEPFLRARRDVEVLLLLPVEAEDDDIETGLENIGSAAMRVNLQSSHETRRTTS